MDNNNDQDIEFGKQFFWLVVSRVTTISPWQILTRVKRQLAMMPATSSNVACFIGEGRECDI